MAFVSIVASPPAGQKTYYVSLQVKNLGSKEVTIVWRQDNKDKEISIPSSGQINTDVIMTASQKPYPIQFRAYEKETTNLIKLNDQDVLSLQPTEAKTPVVVTIKGDSGEMKICFWIVR